jgi:hypothetical protein
MKTWHVCLFAAAAVVTLRDSDALSAGPDAADAGASKRTIPPRVERAALPAFDAEAFPSEKSKAPTLQEWIDAPKVRITRMSKSADCDAKRVREWVKIHCDRRTAGLRLIAGKTDGIALWVPEANTENPFQSMGRFAEIVFPVRQGDRRIFEMLTLDFGEWEGWGTSTAFLVEEEWLEGGTPQIAMLAR